MTGESVLFWLTLVVYLVCSVLYHAHLFANAPAAQRVAGALLPLGLVLHFAGIGVWCTTHSWSILRDPGMPFSLVAFMVALAQFGLNFLPKWSSLGSLTVPIAFLAIFWSGLNASAGTFSSPPATLMLRPHVTVVLLGFAAFTLAFCLAVLYLVQSRMLKTKQIKGFFSRLPPLESVSNASHWLAITGFSMLTLGIITGVMVAPARYGPGWLLDPRVAPSLITSMVAWVIYGAYLGVSLGLGWRGRKTTYFLIAGFVVVLIAMVASVPRKTANRPSARADAPPAATQTARWIIADIPAVQVLAARDNRWPSWRIGKRNNPSGRQQEHAL